MKEFKFLILTLFATLLLFSAFSSKVLAVYATSGTLTSTNLLLGKSVTSVDSFWYNASALGSGLKVQFSNDGGSTWYNSAGTPNGWNNCATIGGATIDLSGLGWSTANFIYRMEFTSDGSNTPVLEEVTVEYGATSTYTPEKTMVDDSSGSDIRGGVVSARSIGAPSTNAAISAREWVVTGYDGVDFPSYLKLQTMYNYTNAAVKTDLSQIAASGTYKILSDYTISSSPCGLPAAVIFVNGDLDITANFRTTAINLGEDPLGYRNECSSSLAFIVRGDITIAPTVNNIYGIFYAGGDMGMSTDLSPNPLYVFGSLLAHDFNLNRNLGADNATYPAEQIIYMPQYLITLKDLLGHAQVSWKEVK